MINSGLIILASLLLILIILVNGGDNGLGTIFAIVSSTLVTGALARLGMPTEMREALQKKFYSSHFVGVILGSIIGAQLIYLSSSELSSGTLIIQQPIIIPAPTSIPTPSATETSTPIPSQTPCPISSYVLINSSIGANFHPWSNFESFRAENPCISQKLGPSDPLTATTIRGAYQEFERNGRMLYIPSGSRYDIYVLFPDGRYEKHQSLYIHEPNESMYPTEMPDAPVGFFKSPNSFGITWVRNPHIHSSFGWGTMCEISNLHILFQSFRGGIAVRINGGGHFTYNFVSGTSHCNPSDLTNHLGKTFVLFASETSDIDGTWVGTR